MTGLLDTLACLAIGLVPGAFSGFAIGFITAWSRALSKTRCEFILLGALIAHGEKTGAELNQLTGIGVPELYPSLERLQKGGRIYRYETRHFGRTRAVYGVRLELLDVALP